MEWLCRNAPLLEFPVVSLVPLGDCRTVALEFTTITSNLLVPIRHGFASLIEWFILELVAAIHVGTIYLDSKRSVLKSFHQLSVDGNAVLTR